MAGTGRNGALGIVDLFLSTFENRIDKKGRLSVPAPFRSVLEHRNDPLYLFKSLTEPCLEGCGPERIGQIVDAIDTMDSLQQGCNLANHAIQRARNEARLWSNNVEHRFHCLCRTDESALYAGIDGPSNLAAKQVSHASLMLVPAQKPTAFQACA